MDKVKKEYESKQEHLEKLVGQLTVEADWLKKNLALNESVEARKVMVERDHTEITIKRQAELLTVNRTSVYRTRQEKRESDENVQIMHQIDESESRSNMYVGWLGFTKSAQLDREVATTCRKQG